MTAAASYRHAEAYMLMIYRADDGTEEETVWNSRDGVTPFVITLRSGKTAAHVDWHRDVRTGPGFVPAPGSRMFVDVTAETAREAAVRNAEHFWALEDYGPMARELFGSVEEMAAKLAAAYLRPGAPALVEVTAPATIPGSS